MKKGDVIVFITVVIMTVFVIFIAVAPKANEGETETETTLYTSSMEALSLSEAETTETPCVSECIDEIEIGTIEEACVTGTPAPFIDDVTEKSSTTRSAAEQRATTQKYTYTTDATTNYLTTKDENCMTDEDYLATVIYKEAGSDYISDETRQYVAEVVLNRVASDKYPNNIHDVLTQYRQYGTFYKTGVPLLDHDNEAVDRAYRIAASVLNGKRDVPSNVIHQAEFPQGSGVWKYIDGIYFCYE